MHSLRARILAFINSAASQPCSGRRVRSFHSDERGVVAVLFAIVFAGIFLMEAIAIDYGRTEAELVRVQNAVDSAALAAAKGRLGTTYTTSALINQMNTKTLAACANAKATGIKVYTIAFRLEGAPATLSLLASCASSAHEAYVASNGAALIQAFESIGREIAKLRVAA